MTGIVLGGLCCLLFLLIAFRNVLTTAFRQPTSGKSTDDQLREIIEREKQRMKDEAASNDSESTHPDAP